MQNFIVLGWVPGTHIQITFQLWIQLVIIILTGRAGISAIHHHRGIAIFILGLYVRRIIRERELTLSMMA